MSGWGPSADQLKQAKLPLRSDKECKEKYSSAYDGRIHLCAGEGRVGASGGCQGDSGGPLALEFGSTWYLHGAVSFGMTRCTTAYYTVFTRITNYIAWIFEKIGRFIPETSYEKMGNGRVKFLFLLNTLEQKVYYILFVSFLSYFRKYGSWLLSIFPPFQVKTEVEWTHRHLYPLHQLDLHRQR